MDWIIHTIQEDDIKKFVLGLVLAIGFSSILLGTDGSLEKVLKDGYFVVGLDDTYPPVGFKDEDGEFVGLDIDLAKEAARRLGVEARFKSCEWDGIIFELRGKQIDMVWNGMVITPERERQISFSKPYYAVGQYIFSRKGEPYTKIAELDGKTVGVQLGSTGQVAVERNTIADDLKDLRKYANVVEVLLDLEAGRLDAAVMSIFVGGYYNLTKNTLALSTENFSEELLGVGFRHEDVSFREAIDKAIDEMKADGTFSQIEAKWLGDLIN